MQNLFAVNPGSNTVSMFAISASNATQLTLLGSPVLVPQADFPVTIGGSAKNSMVCVGSTGTQSGVSCARFVAGGVGTGSLSALGGFDERRDFALGQSTPPVGPFNTISQVLFSADESEVLVLTKGVPNDTAKTGFFSVFPVDQSPGFGTNEPGPIPFVHTQDFRSVPADTKVLFGSANVPGSETDVFVTDASFGAAVLRVDPKSKKASVVGRGVIDGQGATCWVAISPATGTAFVTDVAVNRIVEMSTADASIVGQVDLRGMNQDVGLIDLRAAGNFVYALAPNNGTANAAITVLDVSGGKGAAKAAQHLDIKALGATSRVAGMAVV